MYDLLFFLGLEEFKMELFEFRLIFNFLIVIFMYIRFVVKVFFFDGRLKFILE